MSLEATLERLAAAQERTAAALEQFLERMSNQAEAKPETDKPRTTRKSRASAPETTDPAPTETTAAELPVMTGAEAEKALDGHLNQASTPAEAPAAAPETTADAPAQEPAAEAPAAVTYDTLKAAAYNFSHAGGDRVAVIQILNKFSATKLSDVPEAQWGAAAKAFNEATEAKKASA